MCVVRAAPRALMLIIIRHRNADEIYYPRNLTFFYRLRSSLHYLYMADINIFDHINIVYKHQTERPARANNAEATVPCSIHAARGLSAARHHRSTNTFEIYTAGKRIVCSLAKVNICGTPFSIYLSVTRSLSLCWWLPQFCLTKNKQTKKTKKEKYESYSSDVGGLCDTWCVYRCWLFCVS